MRLLCLRETRNDGVLRDSELHNHLFRCNLALMEPPKY